MIKVIYGQTNDLPSFYIVGNIGLHEQLSGGVL